MPNTEAQTGAPELLRGVRHYESSGFATSWEVYDALTEADGWTEHFAQRSQRKRKTVDGRKLVVHAPTFDRGES